MVDRIVWCKLDDGTDVSGAVFLRVENDGYIQHLLEKASQLFSNEMKGVQLNHIKVYQEEDDGSRVPLQLDNKIGSRGETPETALILQLPKIWYKLFAAGTREALTDVSSVPLPDSSRVDNFRVAVKDSYDGTELNGVDASQLNVYKNVKAYSDPVGVDPTMKSSDKLDGCGMDEEHVIIVEVPQKGELRRLGIDQEHTETIQYFEDIANFLWEMQVKEVKDVIEVLRKVSSASSPRGMRFIVLENSSGTGKTQMAFNLQASKAFDVFYVLCTDPGDREQAEYQAFWTRTTAFLSCIDKDMETLENGSVGDIDKKTTLHVYAFIAAAIHGVPTFQSPGTRADVEQALNDRKRERRKPFVVFLDEFPRGPSSLADKEREKYEAKGKMMRNVFRSFGIPVIISATNGTARNLVSFGERSRVTSAFGDKTPWCVVVPSLPRVCVTDDRIPFTSDSNCKLARIPCALKWILQHSRPLFAKEAWGYMIEHDNYGNTPESWLEYLSDMTGYLAPHIRLLKERKRSHEFQLGQVSMLIASRSTVNDNSVNLIDSHFGCLLESKPFELDLGSNGLFKGKIPWRACCTSPLPERDILLYLTLFGDHKIINHVDEEGVDSILRPIDAPLQVMMQDPFLRGKGFRGKHKTNALESLMVGAVVLASHREKFCGVKFPAFLGRLLYELGVGADIDAEVYLPSGHVKNESKIPFLSVPNTEWPQSFWDAWKGSGAQFANLYRTADSKGTESKFYSSAAENGFVLSGECKDDADPLTLEIVEGVLVGVPRESSIHLVVAKKLQETYFTPAPDPVSAASAALAKVKLQYADFYRISEDGVLTEFMEFMADKATFGEDSSDEVKRGRGNGKLVVFIEIGNWDEPKGDKMKNKKKRNTSQTHEFAEQGPKKQK